MAEVEIRAERAPDIAAVFAVESAAFGRADEARIVDAIRGGEDELVSLVAVDGGIVGHVFFSRVKVLAEPEYFAAALGPVAVAPDRQSSGIGGRLIRAGIEAVSPRFATLFVLGNPPYYSRFGFELARPFGFEYAPGTERAFQMMQLAGTRPPGGRVVYHASFG